jgi:hypothetical protein
VPAARPNMSKVSVRASQVRHLKAKPLKLLREITAAYCQNYKKLSLSHNTHSVYLWAEYTKGKVQLYCKHT